MQCNVPTLEELAEDALASISDLFDDDELDAIEASPALDIIRLRYTNSDCDDFALALNVLMNWPVVAVSSPTKGPLHRLNRDDEGRLVDVMGFVTEDTLRQRYKVKRLMLAENAGAFSSLDDDDGLKRVMAAMTYLPQQPFSDPAFRARAQAWIREGVCFDEPEVRRSPQPG